MANCPHAESKLSNLPCPEWNDHEDTVFARFESMARRFPDRVAVRHANEAVTYDALYNRVLATAATIHAHDASPLGLCLPPCIDRSEERRVGKECS